MKPSTEEHISALARQGIKHLVVVSPSFVADCLETIEELGIRGKEIFKSQGGEVYTLVPCLNDHPIWIDALVKFCGYKL